MPVGTTDGDDAQPGLDLVLAGTFKLSVCNPERCSIDEAPLAIALP